MSMFAVPRVLQAELFACLPEAFRSGQPDQGWAARQSATHRRSVLEGPSFDVAGNFYFVDVPQGCIYRIPPGGAVELVVKYDGLPNGLKIHKDGRIFVTDQKRGLMLLDPVGGHITSYLTETRFGPFKGLNDLFFARNGDLYFTDQGGTGLNDPSGRLFRLRPDGAVSCLVDNIPSPNGLVMNLEETAVYLAVTRGNCIWRVPLTPDGDAARVGVFVQLSGGIGPDGLALDALGRLAIAHAGLGTVWVVDARGEPVYRIMSPTGWHVTNLAFGGQEGRSLFFTEADSASIWRVELETPGKPMYSHQ